LTAGLLPSRMNGSKLSPRSFTRVNSCTDEKMSVFTSRGQSLTSFLTSAAAKARVASMDCGMSGCPPVSALTGEVAGEP